MVVKKVKKETVSFKRHETDTGSPEVQIYFLGEEINLLQGHLVMHKKDVDAKRSLLKKVAKRRKLLKYLKDTDVKLYGEIAKKTGLKV